MMDPNHDLRVLMRPKNAFRNKVGRSIARLECAESHDIVVLLRPFQNVNLGRNIGPIWIARWLFIRYAIH